MKHYLVDTNVVIDMLLNREDADAACAVFDGAERGEYALHICALSFTTMKTRGTVPLIKSQGRSKGFFALQSEPRDLQSLVTIETQEERALLTNIQYNDTLERCTFERWHTKSICEICGICVTENSRGRPDGLKILKKSIIKSK